MYPFSPFRAPGGLCEMRPAFPCEEMIKSCESVMRSDCSGPVLGSSRELCHHWSRLRQDGLGCKTSVPGQSRAQAAPNSALEVARNAPTQEAGVGSAALLQSNSSSRPCPALAWWHLEIG